MKKKKMNFQEVALDKIPLPVRKEDWKEVCFGRISAYE